MYLIMNKISLTARVVVLAMALLISLAAAAQGIDKPVRRAPLTLQGYGFYDFHYATDGIGGGALLLDWPVAQSFTLSAGVEYASSNRIAAKLAGRATLLTTAKKQRLTLENSYLWRHFLSLDLQEFTSALQLGWYARHAALHLGLCNRYFAPLVQRSDGGEATVFEPMNVMFAAEGWWRDQTLPGKWNVGLRWSNYNDFVIERVANWFFSAKGWYLLPYNSVLTIEAGIHPVGSLNLTASYDGWFCHIGALKSF